MSGKGKKIIIPVAIPLPLNEQGTIGWRAWTGKEMKEQGCWMCGMKGDNPNWDKYHYHEEGPGFGVCSRNAGRFVKIISS